MDLKPFKISPDSKVKLKNFETGGEKIFNMDEETGLKELKKCRKKIYSFPSSVF